MAEHCGAEITVRGRGREDSGGRRRYHKSSGEGQEKGWGGRVWDAGTKMMARPLKVRWLPARRRAMGDGRFTAGVGSVGA